MSRRKKKTEYVRCLCGFRHRNGAGCTEISAGDYCPRCGDQLTEYNELHRQHARNAGLFG